MDVKSNTITAISMPNGSVNKKLKTIGKYPSIGIDCKRSTKGVITSDATLLVAANMPKETPQAIEIKSVITILKIVLKVCNGRLLISG
jgi:ribosomal protein L30E